MADQGNGIGKPVCAAAPPDIRAASRSILCRGMTLTEIAIALGVTALLLSLVIPVGMRMIDQLREDQAIEELKEMADEIEDFEEDNLRYPDSLEEIYPETRLDPWGNPYRYLNIADQASTGNERTRNAQPVNVDFDLYSTGPDGVSLPPVTAEASLDDILRGDNGGFYGRATGLR